jgi:O-antigen ligase
MIKILNPKYNIDLFFLFLFLVSLPISKVTAVQNISLLLFIITHFSSYNSYKYFKDIFNFKSLLILFSAFLFLALLSLFNTINFNESLSEIISEIIKPFLYLLLSFGFVKSLNENRLKYVFYILISILLIHTLLNIGVWIYNGGWPARTGAFLDGSIKGIKDGAAERFGIWATYTLSFAFGLTFTKYKKIAYVFILIALISIIANHTRATFIGTIFIFLVYFIFLYKNRIIKVFSLSLIILSIIFFSIYSKNFGERFNIYNMVSSLKYLDDYTPSQFKILEDDYGLGFSTATRFAMWKSVILYRIDEPFVPQSYGRFLYGKSLSEIYKDKKENIPYVLFSQAHSDFMSMLFSLGIFGLILFLLLLGYTLRVSYALTKDENYKSFGVLVFLGTVGYIGSMMFGSFFGDTEQIFFYLLLGATLSIYMGRLNEYKTN